jgi:anaerobic magnesium-protoporphyrin IX monomethyl ester cyclase
MDQCLSTTSLSKPADTSADCLLLGFYDSPFADYVQSVRSFGEDSGFYRDLALAYLEYEGKPYRALDILSRFYNERHGLSGLTFHNSDFLWPVITYLFSFLKRRGFNVDFVNLPHLQEKELRRKLTLTPPLTVAITTTLYVSPQPIIELVSKVRTMAPDTKIIVGGPYISNQVRALPQAGLTRLLSTLGADIYVLCQEGEATLAKVLSALRSGSGLDFVPNLAFSSDRKHFTFTLEQPESNSLPEEMVDYRMFSPAEVNEFITTRTAKSCPFSCAFCGFPARAGAYTYLDVEHVERELEAIAQQSQVTTVTFLDDTFNVPKGRFRDILRMMIRKNYRFKWNSFYRADHGDRETIELMARAGCEGVFLGVESGSDVMLANMNKAARRHNYLSAIKAFTDCGVSTYASLIVGFPGETDQTVEKTIAFIEEAKPEYYRAQLWYADPVTPIWKDREKYGLTGQGFQWKHHTMDSDRACNWVEQMFLSINNSTWLPQFGFEQWSTFYLQRKGMSREKVRSFVSSFNAAIKHRMVSFGAPLPGAIVDALRNSSDFTSVPDHDNMHLQRWSGSAYRQASIALSNELGDPALGDTVEVPHAPHEVSRKLYPVRHGTIDDRDGSAFDDCVPAFLAAYAFASKKTSGEQIILVAVGSEHDELPVPVHFRTSLEMPFGAWLEEAIEKHRTLLTHSRHAMKNFRDPLWRSHNGHSHLAASDLLRISLVGNEAEPTWMSWLPQWGIRELIHIRCSPAAAPSFSAFTDSISKAGVVQAKLAEMISCLQRGSSFS